MGMTTSLHLGEDYEITVHPNLYEGVHIIFRSEDMDVTIFCHDNNERNFFRKIDRAITEYIADQL